MALRYYDAASVVRTKNPKESYYNDYEAMSDLLFENAPNVVYNEIEYEQTYGELDFAIAEKIRTDVILDYNTGIILSDDHQTFYFPTDFPIEPYYGMKFRWKGSYWLVINTSNLNSMVTSAEVRRCNNVLRFYDKDGKRTTEPCIMDYTLRFANNKMTAPITFGNGEQKIWCQRNKRSELIRPNDRFLFGTPNQRVSFRVYAGGTKNYMNNITEDDNSPTITEFYVNHYEANPLFDDLKDGFANAYFNEIHIKIDDLINKISPGAECELTASVYKAGDIIEADLNWSSDKEDIVSVVDNKLIANKIGKATITATLDNDDRITDSFVVEVTDDDIEDKYEIIISPDNLTVLQETSKQFSVALYKNGVKQNNKITIRNMTDKSMSLNYEITGGEDNTFTVENKRMCLDYPVIVECSCDNIIVETFEIELGGLY